MTIAPALAISSRMTPKSAPLLEDNAPATFSQIEILGYSLFVSFRISLMIRMPSWNKPERSPSSPARLPATERSWHGLPHATTSGGVPCRKISLAVSVVMSPHRGT